VGDNIAVTNSSDEDITHIKDKNTLNNVSRELNGLIFIRYLDNVQYNRCSPLAMKPQQREAIGWLVYEGKRYITLSWDRDAEPPTLKGGDPKASGLVLLKSEILELRRLKAFALPVQGNSSSHLNSTATIVTGEYALPPTGRKTRRKTKGKTAT
jgi:hypothetical protein